MRKTLFTLLFAISYAAIYAQSFEGLLSIDYKSETGNRSAADVYVKGEKFYIKKVFGGCSRYNEYIYSSKTRVLSCLSPQPPKTALSLDADNVMDIYEKKQLRSGYHVHISHPYEITGASKKIEGVIADEKKASDSSGTYDIWETDLKISFGDLLPILRVIGYWGDAEDGDNAILESKTITGKSLKASTITLTPQKMKVDDNIFIIPDSYQQVDLDKFLVNESKSPRFNDLVKAFTGFTQ
jgi:hypothetical protein